MLENGKDKKISILTAVELFEIQKEIFNNERIFDYSFIEIGKLFLSKLLIIDVYKSEFITVKNEYIKSIKNNDVKEKEKELEFYKYICLEYLYLEKEPREIIFYLYKIVSKDLEEIEKNILFLNNEFKELESKKQNMENRYYLKQINFYKEKNKIAKDEIIDFLINKIKNYAIEKSQRDFFKGYLFNSFFGEMPYRFSKASISRIFGSQYDIRNLTPISNKFLDLPVRVYPEIKELYVSNKKDFFEFAKMYISEEINDNESVISKIMTAVNTNHILNRRKNVLETILKHYKNEDYISVVNMLALQIEGIFHDISIELGISESQSNKTAINKLLESLNEKTQSFHYFEYYSFIFPITRNRVAHGELIEDNLEHTAIMLILDLLPVCQFATSEDIKINKVLKLMKSIKKDKKEQELVEFINYLDIDIPEFYNLLLRENILNYYDEENFWDYIESELINEGNKNINDSKMTQYVKVLKKKEIALAKCNEFFKNISKLNDRIREEKENINEFLNLVN